jgi:hypothetical protein
LADPIGFGDPVFADDHPVDFVDTLTKEEYAFSTFGIGIVCCERCHCEQSLRHPTGTRRSVDLGKWRSGQLLSTDAKASCKGGNQSGIASGACGSHSDATRNEMRKRQLSLIDPQTIQPTRGLREMRKSERHKET